MSYLNFYYFNSYSIYRGQHFFSWEILSYYSMTILDCCTILQHQSGRVHIYPQLVKLYLQSTTTIFLELIIPDVLQNHSLDIAAEDISFLALATPTIAYSNGGNNGTYAFYCGVYVYIVYTYSMHYCTVRAVVATFCSGDVCYWLVLY